MLNFDQHRLTQRGCDLKLSKLTSRTLHVLVSAAPALITHEELGNLVWSGRAVSPETVVQRVKLLRQALHDDARDPRYIEVVHGQGYRWIPAVVPISQTRSDSPHFLGNADTPKGIELALPSQPSVAVLPFVAMGDDQSHHQVFCDNLTHDVITGLGRTRWLFVAARGSAFMFRGGSQDVQDVSQKLGTRYVVQGSISFSGSKICVYAALADAVQGGEIWAEKFRGSVDDVFTIQEEIINLIVGSVEIEIEQAEQRRALLVPSANLDAWSAHHRGWAHLSVFTVDGFDQAEQYFRESIRLDPNSARPYAGLSCVHWLRAFLELKEDRQGEIQKCLQTAQQSVELDSRDPLAHWALGRALQLCEDLKRSVAQFEIANDLNPSSALGQFAQAFALSLVGDHERSNRILAVARRLSPYDPLSHTMFGVQAINNAMLGNYEDAADLSDRGAALQTIYCQMFPAIAAYCNALAGRVDVAGKYFAELLESRPGYSSSDYFRAFPHQRDEDISRITSAFESLNQMQ